MAIWSSMLLSEVGRVSRLDAEYFRPDYLALVGVLQNNKAIPIADFAFVTDGIHASPDVVEEGGVRYLSAKCVKDNDFAIGDTLFISSAQNNANKRTQLKCNDVLITTVGTIGNAAVVSDDLLPANADRHLGIIRINADSGIDPYYLATFLNSQLGRFQTLREATGNVQLNLFIEKIKTLGVVFTPGYKKVAELTRKAYARRKEADEHYLEAQTLLETSLGFDKLDLTPRLCYQRSYAEVQASERCDAEYFSPRMQNLMAALSRQNLVIGDVAKLSKRRFKPTPGKHFRYIEIADVTRSGTADSNIVAGEDAPSRATWTVKPGDVITTTVRPIRRLSAIITGEQADDVCTSGFAVLTAEKIAPELLLVYLRLPLLCELLNLYTTASMYPAISTGDLMDIPIALPKPQMQQEIISKVQKSNDARRDARQLLEKAKATIEKEVVGKMNN